jgi:hypothetical protein
MAHRLGHEREVGVERLGDVVGQRAQERLADDARGPGRDGAQEIALPGGVAGVGDGRFEEGGQDGGEVGGVGEPRW